MWPTVQLHQIAKQFPKGMPPIPVGHPEIGMIGFCEPGREFRLKGMSTRSYEALLRDDISVRKALRESGAITTWDGVLNARANGYADDRLFYKASQTTVANAWSSFWRSSGYPGAGTFTNIPGGSAPDADTAGAFILTHPTGGRKKYLLNFGVQHLSGTNIVALVDLLVEAGNISANTSSPQTVNTTSLTRYTSGVGVMMTFDVTTALGGTSANMTVTYTNQSGTSNRTTTQSMTTSCIVYRLQPTVGGMLTPLQAGDSGVRSVESITFSQAMGAGVLGLMLYYPLLLMPTLSTTTYVERSTPGMLSGIQELVQTSGNKIGCLTVFVLPSGTSTGVQTYFLQTCEG